MDGIIKGIQRGIGGIFIFVGLGLLVYKVKSADFANFFLQRFYLVMIEIRWLLIFFVVLQIAFIYIFNIVYTID